MAAFESGAVSGITAIAKFGWVKFATLGAALAGAVLMAMFRPPKTRKEMFFQASVALGTSFLFGPTVVAASEYYLPFHTDPYAIHGLIGALSWGLFGGLAHTRDKLESKSLDENVKDFLA